MSGCKHENMMVRQLNGSVACKKLGRNFIGFEKDYKYFEIAKNRIASVQQKRGID